MFARRSWTAAALAVAPTLVASLLLVGSAEAQPAPRIMGSSVGIEPKKFEARVLIENDPGARVARVVFALTPRCTADPTSSKFTSVPEVTASVATAQGAHRVFTASIPDPSDGAFGAWVVRATAQDAAGAVLGRHQTIVVRRFEPRFRTLAFESPKLDTSGGPGAARLLVDLEHDAPITSVGLITSTHDNPTLGYTQLPGELASDKAAGTTPWLTSRIEQKAPTSLVGHFGFPASTPPMKLAIQRIFLTDARCRTAELAPPKPLELAVSSAKPRALPVDVRLDRDALAAGKLVVAFRLLGPAARTAPAPEIEGERAPLVTVNLLDGATPPKVLGTTAARPVPAPKIAERRWDGESMATPPITIPPGPTALSEALKRGLQLEIDDGSRPLAPRAVVKAP